MSSLFSNSHFETIVRCFSDLEIRSRILTPLCARVLMSWNLKMRIAALSLISLPTSGLWRLWPLRVNSEDRIRQLIDPKTWQAL